MICGRAGDRILPWRHVIGQITKAKPMQDTSHDAAQILFINDALVVLPFPACLMAWQRWLRLRA